MVYTSTVITFALLDSIVTGKDLDSVGLITAISWLLTFLYFKFVL